MLTFILTRTVQPTAGQMVNHMLPDSYCKKWITQKDKSPSKFWDLCCAHTVTSSVQEYVFCFFSD